MLAIYLAQTSLNLLETEVLSPTTKISPYSAAEHGCGVQTLFRRLTRARKLIRLSGSMKGPVEHFSHLRTNGVGSSDDVAPNEVTTLASLPMAGPSISRHNRRSPRFEALALVSARRAAIVT